MDFEDQEKLFVLSGSDSWSDNTSSLHGLGIFSMDGIKVSYNKVIKLMEYVRPCYDYSSWMHIVRYKKSMCRYGLVTNYIQQKVSEQSKTVAI